MWRFFCFKRNNETSEMINVAFNLGSWSFDDYYYIFFFKMVFIRFEAPNTFSNAAKEFSSTEIYVSYRVRHRNSRDNMPLVRFNLFSFNISFWFVLALCICEQMQ